MKSRSALPSLLAEFHIAATQLVVSIAIFCQCGIAAAQTPASPGCEIKPGDFLTNATRAQLESARIVGLPPFTPVGNSGVNKFHVDGVDTIAFINNLKQQARTAGAALGSNIRIEPNHILRLTGGHSSDPFFNRQWGLRNTGMTSTDLCGKENADIHVMEAWKEAKESMPVIVAVLDSGLDSHHPDFGSNLWQAPADFPLTFGSGPQVSCNAQSIGFDAVAQRCAAAQDVKDAVRGGHGTEVASIIAARHGDGVGMAGISNSAQLLTVRMFDENETSSIEDAISAISFMRQLPRDQAQPKVRILSASWGYEVTGSNELCVSQLLRDEIAKDPQLLLIAAAGNYGHDLNDKNKPISFYPAGFDLENIVAVTVSTYKDTLEANYGRESVDIAAPGIDIYSAMARSQPGDPPYGYFSGTSFATPFVSGTAALIVSTCPQISAKGVKELLLENVDVRADMTDKLVSKGRLNAYAALHKLNQQFGSYGCR